MSYEETRVDIAMKMLGQLASANSNSERTEIIAKAKKSLSYEEHQ